MRDIDAVKEDGSYTTFQILKELTSKKAVTTSLKGWLNQGPIIYTGPWTTDERLQELAVERAEYIAIADNNFYNSDYPMTTEIYMEVE